MEQHANMDLNTASYEELQAAYESMLEQLPDGADLAIRRGGTPEGLTATDPRCLEARRLYSRIRAIEMKRPYHAS